MHGKEEDKGRKQSGVAGIPPTCNSANARKVRPMAKEITEGIVWWKGEKSLVSESCHEHFWEMLY